MYHSYTDDLNNIQGLLKVEFILDVPQMKVIPSVHKEDAGILFLSCTLVFNVTINNDNNVHCRSTTYMLDDHLKFTVTYILCVCVEMSVQIMCVVLRTPMRIHVERCI